MTIHARRRASRIEQGVAIADAHVNLPTLTASLSEAVERAGRGEGFTLFTLNLDHLVKLKKNDDFRAAYGRADLVSADGWPVVWLSKKLGARSKRACGADMVEPLCEAAADRGMGVFFVGPGVSAQKVALDSLRRRHPSLIIAGAEAPRLQAGFRPDAPALTPHAFSVDALAQRINASGARFCFVSMGAPKQEVLADALASRCPTVGFLCVGAALDFISNETVRAPLWMQRMNLEWLWRLAGDPRRLTGRYVQCVVRLVELAVPTLLGRNRSAASRGS